MAERENLKKLLAEVRACRVCADHLPLGPRPVLRAAATARILIVGQAPGTRVHATGVPWDDPSGERLRSWLGIAREVFYDETRVAIIPMGFCYPGRLLRGGDCPPRPECAPMWHPRLRACLPQLETTVLCGAYALRYYLGDRAGKSLTETVRNWRRFAPEFVPLPHPSPRNNLWLKKNAWFVEDVVPYLQARVGNLLG